MVADDLRNIRLLHTQTWNADIGDDWDITQAEVAVGILIFDVEHREMLDRLRELYRGIAEGDSQQRVRHTLKRLLDVTKKHFDHEEDYMRTLKYADFRQHAADHLALGADLQAFMDGLFAADASPDRNLAAVRTYFRRWLLDHILEHDRTLANFLAQRNIR